MGLTWAEAWAIAKDNTLWGGGGVLLQPYAPLGVIRKGDDDDQTKHIFLTVNETGLEIC